VTQTAATESAVPASKSLAARLLGVLLSPKAAYADVAAAPRWFGALGVVLLLTMGPTAAFLSTDVGKQAMLDQQIRQAESFGRTLNDAQYQRLERMAQYAPYVAVAGQLVSLPLVALVLAGIALAVFNAILGGDATFQQVFSIVSHSGMVIGLSTLFAVPLDYARETLTSPANLAVFLPFLDENSFAARFLGSVDLFHVWWIVSLAIGFGALYRRRTGPIATTLFVVYGAIVLAIAAIRTALAGV
jgi:hypothetical protein